MLPFKGLLTRSAFGPLLCKKKPKKTKKTQRLTDTIGFRPILFVIHAATIGRRSDYNAAFIWERKAISLGNWVATHSGTTSLSLINYSNVNTRMRNLDIHSNDIISLSLQYNSTLMQRFSITG